MTRTLFRGAFMAAFILAAPFNADADVGDKIRKIETMAVIPFAHSSAELTFDAIRTLSNLAREQRLDVSRRIVIYTEGAPASGPIARLRFAQIKDLLIDLGLPPGQIALPALPLCHAPYLTIQAAGKLSREETSSKSSDADQILSEAPASLKRTANPPCPASQVPE